MESCVQAALEYLRANPGAKVLAVAKQFGVSRQVLRGRLEGRSSYSDRPAANTRLTEAEEKALCNYIDRLDRINLRCRANFVTDAANQLLQARKGPGMQVGVNWTTRFLQRYGYNKVLDKKLDANRKVSEDLDRAIAYF